LHTRHIPACRERFTRSFESCQSISVGKKKEILIKRPAAAHPAAEIAQHYRVLQIPLSATEDEVKQAFIRRAKQTHPDKKGGNKDLFHQVRSSYEFVMDTLHHLTEGGCVGGLQRKRKKIKTLYAVEVGWASFYVKSGYTPSLEEAFRWYAGLCAMRCQAREKMQSTSAQRITSRVYQSSVDVCTKVEVDALLLKEPLLRLSFYTRIKMTRNGKQKDVVVPSTQDFLQAMTFKRTLDALLRRTKNYEACKNLINGCRQKAVRASSQMPVSTSLRQQKNLKATEGTKATSSQAEADPKATSSPHGPASQRPPQASKARTCNHSGQAPNPDEASSRKYDKVSEESTKSVIACPLQGTLMSLVECI